MPSPASHPLIGGIVQDVAQDVPVVSASSSSPGTKGSLGTSQLGTNTAICHLCFFSAADTLSLWA